MSGVGLLIFIRGGRGGRAAQVGARQGVAYRSGERDGKQGSGQSVDWKCVSKGRLMDGEEEEEGCLRDQVWLGGEENLP